MTSAGKLTERLRAMLRGREDRPEDKWLGDGVSPPVTVKELLRALESQAAEIERLKPFEQVFRHAWEVDTKFDKAGKPRQIKVLFKTTTLTSASMQQSVRSLLTDFNENAASQAP